MFRKLMRNRRKKTVVSSSRHLLAAGGIKIPQIKSIQNKIQGVVGCMECGKMFVGFDHGNMLQKFTQLRKMQCV